MNIREEKVSAWITSDGLRYPAREAAARHVAYKTRTRQYAITGTLLDNAAAVRDVLNQYLVNAGIESGLPGIDVPTYQPQAVPSDWRYMPHTVFRPDAPPQVAADPVVSPEAIELLALRKRLEDFANTNRRLGADEIRNLLKKET